MSGKSVIVDVGRSGFCVIGPAVSSIAKALAFPVLSMKDQETLCGDFCYCGFGVSWPTFFYTETEAVATGRKERGRLEGRLASVLRITSNCLLQLWTSSRSCIRRCLVLTSDLHMCAKYT